MGTDQTDGPNNEAVKKTHPKRSKLRTAFKAVFTLTAVLAVGTAVVFYLARSEPAYWKEHQKLLRDSTPQQIEQLAKEVNDQLLALSALGLDELDREAQAVADSLNALTDPDAALAIEAGADGDLPNSNIKPEDVHINVDKMITLNNEQLAAVVQTRMDQWMGERGYVKPDEINDPMIAVSGGGLVMAFQLEAGGITQVISGRFDLAIRKDGMAELTMDRFLVGSLPVPANAIAEHLRNLTGDDRAVKAGEWLSKLQYMQFKPVIKLEHRRRARVQDYKLLEKGLELTVRVQDHKTYKAMNTAMAGVTTD